MTDTEAVRIAELESLLRRAWWQLGTCICRGDEGSADYERHQQLLEAIDDAIPRLRVYDEDNH